MATAGAASVAAAAAAALLEAIPVRRHDAAASSAGADGADVALTPSCSTADTTFDAPVASCMGPVLRRVSRLHAHTVGAARPRHGRHARIDGDGVRRHNTAHTGGDLGGDEDDSSSDSDSSDSDFDDSTVRDTTGSGSGAGAGSGDGGGVNVFSGEDVAEEASLSSVASVRYQWMGNEGRSLTHVGDALLKALARRGISDVIVSAPTTELEDHYTRVFTVGAVSFVAALCRVFDAPFDALLRRRGTRHAAESGAGSAASVNDISFALRTRHVRESHWTVDPLPPAISELPTGSDNGSGGATTGTSATAAATRVELCGVSAADTPSLVRAFNSEANSVQVDFAAAHCPTWYNTVLGHDNLRAAAAGNLAYVDAASGRVERLSEVSPADRPLLFVRPRPWVVRERHMMVAGREVLGGVVDFALHAYHSGADLAASGRGPFVTLGDIRDAAEARVWAAVVAWAEKQLRLPRGCMRVRVVVDCLECAFQLDEILWELRAHSAGLVFCDWGFAASYARRFRTRSDRVLPDRAELVGSAWLRAAQQHVIDTARRHGAVAGASMLRHMPAHPASRSVRALKGSASRYAEADELELAIPRGHGSSGGGRAGGDFSSGDKVVAAMGSTATDALGNRSRRGGGDDDDGDGDRGAAVGAGEATRAVAGAAKGSVSLGVRAADLQRTRVPETLPADERRRRSSAALARALRAVEDGAAGCRLVDIGAVPQIADALRAVAARAPHHAHKVRSLGDTFATTGGAAAAGAPAAATARSGAVAAAGAAEVAAASALLAVPAGRTTLGGLRHAVTVGTLMIEAWLRGCGHVQLQGVVEDGSTAELACLQVWQWLRVGVRLEGGLPVTRLSVRDVLFDVVEAYRGVVTRPLMDLARLRVAARLFEEAVNMRTFPLSLGAFLLDQDVFWLHSDMCWL